PISQTIWEGQQVANAARRHHRVIQCGTQSRSNPALYGAKRFLDAGSLGAIKYAIATCYKLRPSIGKLAQPLAIPSELDYDLWCGPAAKVDLYRPQLHYDWHWDFNTGNGDLGNQGVHQMDIARWFLGEEHWPAKVHCIGGRVGYDDAADTANTQSVFYAYPKAPLLFEVRGLPTQKGSEEMDIYLGSRVGVIVQCEKGHLLIPSYTEAFAFDEKGEQLHRWNYGDDQLHYNNFLTAVSKNDAKLLNAEASVSHASSSLCHLGNISYQSGDLRPVADVEAAVQGIDLLSDSLRRMLVHLEANGLKRDELQLTWGAPLEIDSTQDRIVSPGSAATHLRREDRAPFLVPEIKV
ncbi:MAG TPA: gfo/Idh/MocA family oxidoreductase, partial [Pirellulaceae bacterium]